jgi:hypothetical protein
MAGVEPFLTTNDEDRSLFLFPPPTPPYFPLARLGLPLISSLDCRVPVY